MIIKSIDNVIFTINSIYHLAFYENFKELKLYQNLPTL